MNKKDVIIAVLATLCLTATLFMITSARSNPSITAGTYQTGVFSKSYGYGTIITLNNASWTTLLSISLPNIPISAHYNVVCDGYAAMAKSEARFAIGVETATEDEVTRRFYSDPSVDLTLTGVHTERVYHLGAGSHTFYFLGKIHRGPSSGGFAFVDYHTITVTVFTDGSATVLSTTPQTSVSEDGS